MAYLDQRAGTNQRAVIATAVALLQGAAIIALVNGLAVHFIPIAEKPRLEGRQINMPLQPLPDAETKQETKLKETIQPEKGRRTFPLHRQAEQPLGASGNAGTSAEFPEGREQEIIVPLPLPPQPRYTQQAAHPRNNPQSWIGRDDYPTQELRMGHQGSVGFSLTIGTNGRVEACVVTVSSGYPGLDQAACKYISHRARFEPATDGTGSPVTWVSIRVESAG